MNGPYIGCDVFASTSATDGLAGNSPTMSSQTCIASSEVRYCMNLLAAASFSPLALELMPLTQ